MCVCVLVLDWLNAEGVLVTKQLIMNIYILAENFLNDYISSNNKTN